MLTWKSAVTWWLLAYKGSIAADEQSEDLEKGGVPGVHVRAERDLVVDWKEVYSDWYKAGAKARPGLAHEYLGRPRSSR